MMPRKTDTSLVSTDVPDGRCGGCWTWQPEASPRDWAEERWPGTGSFIRGSRLPRLALALDIAQEMNKKSPRGEGLAI